MKHSKFRHLATAYAAKAYLSRRSAKRPPVPCISDHPAILARLLPAPGDRLESAAPCDAVIARWFKAILAYRPLAR